MRNSILLVLFAITLVFAVDKPTNYFAANNAARAQQQQVANFAVWNTTSNSWINVLPPNVNGNVNGIVSVGTGLLAFGDFSSISGSDAAGLAYYDGNVWCTPEGVGLFSYAPNVYTTQYNNTPTGTAAAFAANVIGNDVYLLGTFNQVGLVRDGVAGFVRLTWSQGGVFTINKIGNQGYYQVQNGLPCSFCQNSTQPSAGGRNKLLSYTNNGQTYFVFHDNSPGDLYQWAVDTPNWVKITNTNSARNITGKVADFDISSNGILFVVGNFQNLQDPNPANQYLHIACSLDQGNTWNAVGNPSPLPVANFGDLPAFQNNVTGIYLPALTGSGLFSIAVESPTSIYVAGGYRITERNITNDNLAGQLQTRVIRISGSTYTLVSERFAGNAYTTGSPNFRGPTIDRLILANKVLYAFGAFTNYRQVVPVNGTRFGMRFTDSYKGAACLSNNVWAPAFGGYLTSGYSNDATPAVSSVFTAFSASNNLMYFYGAFQSTYGVLSGGVFAYGGDKKLNRNNRWNAVLQNQRFVTANSALNANGIGTPGTIYSLYLTNRNDALIIGGQFDWIGSQRIGGIAAYNPVSDTVQQIGGGIYFTNQKAIYYGDNSYNTRVGGIVYDIAEWSDRLIIAGTFNRNNTGSCVSNIAWNRFRISGAGWEAIDGGCDQSIYDILVVGSVLYATGSFQYCGLNPAGYNGGLYRGAVPTSYIARIDLGDSKRSWRNLGIGLQGGAGRALAWRNGDLFVGGSFSSAGGRIATNGIARWRGDHWEDVVAKCRGNCDRPVNVLPYITTADVPFYDVRKPVACISLKNIGGRIYCIDSNLNRLAWFGSNTWYQAADYSVFAGKQNSVISVNGTNDDLINVPSTSSFGSNGANFVSFDTDNNQFAPSNGGFSVAPNAMAAGSFIYPSMILASLVLILSFMF